MVPRIYVYKSQYLIKGNNLEHCITPDMILYQNHGWAYIHGDIEDNEQSVRALDLSSHFYSNSMIYPKGLLGNLS